MAYTPTEKDRWNVQQRAIAEQRRRVEADRREVDKLRAQMAKDELAHRKAMQKMQQDAIAAIESEAAAEEKALLSEPKTKYAGATRKNPDAIIVWHHGVEQPSEWEVKKRRHGLGPLLALKPGGGDFTKTDAAYAAIRQRHPEVTETHPEYVAAVRKALTETTARYPLLAALRDDRRMASVFEAANIVLKTTDKITVPGEYGVYKRDVTTINVPTLTDVTIRAAGLELTYKQRLGDNAARWNKNVDMLRNAFRSLGIDPSKMKISETKSGDIKLSFFDRDPFEALDGITTGEWDDEGFRSLLGVDHDGRKIWIDWKDTSGMVIGGFAGSGKTASLLPVFAGFEGNAELYIFDGKAQRDLHPLRHICAVYDNSGDLEAPLETVERLEALRVMRGDAMYKATGAASFWHLNREQRRSLKMKPIFLVLDEAQTWTKPSSDAAKKKISLRITEAVETLIRKGRSAGIIVILTTQRPSAESIPTEVRDNAQLRICFRVPTDIMATMTLGSCPDGIFNPTEIPMSAKGRFVMDTENAGLVLGQAGYIKPADLETRLETAEPVADQWTVAEELAGGERGTRKTDEQAPVVKTVVETGPAGGVDTEVKTATPSSPDPAPEPLSDDDLLRALAEAQRRGMLKRSESRAPSADVIGEV